MQRKYNRYKRNRVHENNYLKKELNYNYIIDSFRGIQ